MSCSIIELVKGSTMNNEIQDSAHSKERKRYIKNKLLYEAVLHCIKEKNGLHESTENIHKILISMDLSQQVKIKVHNSLLLNDEVVLGLRNLYPDELSYEEGKLLKNEIEQKLLSQYQNTHRPVYDAIEQFLKKSSNTATKLLIDFRIQLNDEQDRYMKNLHKHIRLLKELFTLRNKCLNEISTNKIKEYNSKTKIQNIKSKLLYEKTKMDIFTDTEVSLDAYRELIKDIGQEQKHCQNQVENLCALKEKYHQVRCHQFENILKSYIEYKTATEKRRKLFEHIKLK